MEMLFITYLGRSSDGAPSCTGDDFRFYGNEQVATTVDSHYNS